MPPLPGPGPVPPDWGQPAQQWQGQDQQEQGIYGQLASLSVSDDRPADSGSRHEQVTHFLQVAMQMLWRFEGFRAQVCGLPPSSDPLVSGVQTIMVSITERQGSPLSSPLLHSALHGVYAEQSRFDSINDPCEALEVVIGKFCASTDRRFAGCVEQLFGMSIMEMCECNYNGCGEMLEPMTYKQSASFVSVPTLLGLQSGVPGTIAQQLATALGPNCPVPTCKKQMGIQRYLMQPVPQVMSISFTYEGMGATSFGGDILGALLPKAEMQLDLQQTYKGVSQPVVGSLIGMLVCAQGDGAGPRYSGFFYDAPFDPSEGHWSSFNAEAQSSVIGTDWSAVTTHCVQQQLQPAVLFYSVQLTSAAVPAPAQAPLPQPA